MTGEIRCREFGKLEDGRSVNEFILVNKNGFSVGIIEFGAIIRFIRYPGPGEFNDVVLGFDDLKSYVDDQYYIGCIIGRVANRIRDGEVLLNNSVCKISTNLGKHSLHGGKKGWNKQFWHGSQIIGHDFTGVELAYISPDGEEGFPGKVNVKIRYILNNLNGLTIEYEAKSDKQTIVNLTQHSYFNLSGKLDNKINNQYIRVNADKILETNAEKIPTGNLVLASQSNLDLKKSQKLGDVFSQCKNGIDHYFVANFLQANKPVAILEDKENNRCLEVFTDASGLQVYTGQYLPDLYGKNKTEFGSFCGICLETHEFPYNRHQSNETIVLNPAKIYRQITVWKFS